MATSYVMPMGTMVQPMVSGLQTGTPRNMNLPFSLARPIQVTETTPNLEEIQNFPVIGVTTDGKHFYQDPITGQIYVMSNEFHEKMTEMIQKNQYMSNSNTFVDSYLSDLPEVDGLNVIKTNTQSPKTLSEDLIKPSLTELLIANPIVNIDEINRKVSTQLQTARQPANVVPKTSTITNQLLGASNASNNVVSTESLENITPKISEIVLDAVSKTGIREQMNGEPIIFGERMASEQPMIFDESVTSRQQITSEQPILGEQTFVDERISTGRITIVQEENIPTNSFGQSNNIDQLSTRQQMVTKTANIPTNSFGQLNNVSQLSTRQQMVTKTANIPTNSFGQLNNSTRVSYSENNYSRPTLPVNYFK